MTLQGSWFAIGKKILALAAFILKDGKHCAVYGGDRVSL